MSRYRNRWRRSVLALSTVVMAGAACASPPGPPAPPATARHVLLISVDGLHQSDLAAYTAQHPASALAALSRAGVSYANAATPVPSDSFPGSVAEVTGGNPATTGVYYDNVWDRTLLPPGTTTCASRPPGAAVTLTEETDRDKNAIDGGQGLPGLPGNAVAMTARPADVLDPTKLPVDPTSCTPMLPHRFLAVNTVFEVARSHGLGTAWSDKHPAYDILNGPSGTGIQDLFTPEVDSQADGLPAGDDWTTDNAATQRYDDIKVRAVRNELDGFDHARTRQVGVPGVLGMNFQSVSTAQKLPTSGGAAGGYLSDGHTPGPVLSAALDAVDRELASLQKEIDDQHLRDSTTVIVTAKHGQSPTEPGSVLRIDDGPILDGLNAAWTAAHPGAPDLVAHSSDDDGMLLWLSDRSPAATDFTRAFLLAQSGAGKDIAGQPRPYTAAGLARVDAGPSAAATFHARPDDPRVPDVVGAVTHGVVFTGDTSKIAEHGGSDPEDRSVPILVSGPGIAGGQVMPSAVATTQIAPTILQALDLDPGELQAVRAENTAPLPR